MKIRENFFITNNRGHNYYEPARIIFCKQNALTDKFGINFNASTHNYDKRTTASKAVEETRHKFRITMNHKAATHFRMMVGRMTTSRDKFCNINRTNFLFIIEEAHITTHNLLKHFDHV